MELDSNIIQPEMMVDHVRNAGKGDARSGMIKQ